MAILSGDRPLATTKQFRAAVRSIIHERIAYTYTDKALSSKKKRYVAFWPIYDITEKQIENIEFILWGQGVTANTRLGDRALRGTCIIGKKNG